MRRLALVLSALLTETLPAAPISAQSTGSIEGIVLIETTGEPTANARVCAQAAGTSCGGQGPASRFATTTAQDGRFALRGLLPGRYALSVSRPGASNSGGITVDIAAGDQIQNLQLKLVLFSSISGRVLDESGRPRSGVQVTLARREYDAQGNLRLAYTGGCSGQAHGPQVSGENGEYRIDNVPAGDYYVAAVAAAEAGGGCPYWYYPGVSSVEQAATLTLPAGGELGGISLTYPQRQLYSATLKLESLDPLPNVFFQLAARGTMTARIYSARES